MGFEFISDPLFFFFFNGNIGFECQQDPMGIVQQKRPDAVFEKRLPVNGSPQFVHESIQFQDLFGVAAVKPGSEKPHKEFQAVRIGSVGHLLAVEFKLVNGGVDQFPVDAILDQIIQGVENDALYLLYIRFPDIFEAAGKRCIAAVGIESGTVAERRPQSGVHQGFSEGGRRISQKDFPQQRQHQHVV